MNYKSPIQVNVIDEMVERRRIITFQELLKVLNEETYVAVEDVHTEQEVEGDSVNSIIQRLDGEVVGIRANGTITITVDFADMRGEK